jgi:magnesium transporter
MITARVVRNGAVETLTDPVAAAADAHGGEGVVWFDMVGDDPQIPALMAALGVDAFLVEDLMETATHPKAEVRGNHMLLVVHSLDVDLEAEEFGLETAELDALLGPTWLVTHADSPLDVTARTAELLARGTVDLTGPAPLLHLLLDTLIDEYEPFIDQFIPDRVEAVEDVLFEGRADPAARQEIHLRRRDVQRLQRTSTPQAEAVRRAASLSTSVAPGQQHLFVDVADRLTRVAAQTEALRAQLDTAFGLYQTLIANSQNEIMKVLTMVSATLLPITVVAGIYGMNFVYMPELDERWTYPAVLVFNVLIVATSLAFFRWKGWIGRREGPRRGPGSLDLGLGRVLRTPAMGARAVTRGAGRLVRRSRP